MFILPKITLEVERWKLNKEYNLYVSNKGNFKSADNRKVTIKVKSNGYLTVFLGKKHIKSAHRLVLMTWKPKTEEEYKVLTVEHINHNKRNNSLSNLEWLTKEENERRERQDRCSKDEEQVMIDEGEDNKNIVSKLPAITKETFILVNGVQMTVNNFNIFLNNSKGVPNRGKNNLQCLIQEITRLRSRKSNNKHIYGYKIKEINRTEELVFNAE